MQTSNLGLVLYPALGVLLASFLGSYMYGRDCSDTRNDTEDITDQVRVLCWIMTHTYNLERKAVHVQNTWARRCDKVIFISTKTDKTFPTIGFDLPEGRDHLHTKAMHAFRYIYENHLDDADWFLKADDDSYVIMENLRHFLSGEDPDEPIFFGHHFKLDETQGYFSGGAGYVISKEALRRFGDHGSDPSVCRQEGGMEDVFIGLCLGNLGVKVGDSTDRLGRSRFHCFLPEKHILGKYPDWYYVQDSRDGRKGMDSMSDYAISFHYVTPERMYAMEYFIYHLRPYGVESRPQDLNKKKGQLAGWI